MKSEVDWERLESELATAIRDPIHGVLMRHRPGDVDVVDIQPDGEQFSDWEYVWPDGGAERFDDCRYYVVRGASGVVRVLVGATERQAYGELRDRIVVFGQVGKRSARTHRPWTEFVRTRFGTFAATIPDPHRPRGLLSDGDRFPERFARARVERADQLFDSMINAPSLRFVVDKGDVDSMISHGYWVARLRGRL